MTFDWDFFIAHAGADIEPAEALYEHLNGAVAKVFLDKKNLLLGDNWDAKIAQAQRASLITLVLVSGKTDRAYYEREEIAAAVALARENENSHRVIPVFLDEAAEVPYGLRLKHGLRLDAGFDISDAADLLLAQLPQVKALAQADQGAVVTPPAPLPPPKVMLNLAVDQNPANDDASADEAHTLAYEYTTQRSGGAIVIRPRMDYLDLIAAGGPIDPTRFTWVPFSWDFPKLDFKLVNNSKETVLFTDVIFEISESRLDPAPVLVVKPDVFQSNALHFRLSNEGWGPAVGLKARFHLAPASAEGKGKPRYDEPYPYELALGDLEEVANVDVSTSLTQAGVDLAGLEGLGTLSHRIGDQTTLVNAQGVERTFTAAQLAEARKAFFGPFQNGAALLSGQFEYNTQTVDGESEARSVKFWTVVWIYNENRKGVPRPPGYEYATKFRVEGKDYERQVSISQELKAGETDRFLVKIGIDKSSRHRFRARLLFNNGREILSPSVELHGFAPRSGIEYVRDKKTRP
jgi:TIR domain-containing protein